MTFHDGGQRVTTYNAASDVATYTDENGTVFTYYDPDQSIRGYDAAGRLVDAQVTPTGDVAGQYGDATRGTTRQFFLYDGLSRRTYARDHTAVDGADIENAAVDLYHDSIGRIIEEAQAFDTGDARYKTHHAFRSYPPTGFTFPNNRKAAYNHDELYRRQTIVANGRTVADWAFFGPARVAEMRLGNGFICSYMNEARTNSAVQKGDAE